MIAVIAASSAKRRSVQILTYCRGHCIYTASRARHICMLRDNWPVIDWREPIGLQERLEGRSSHNGVISVMSRSRFQGTEVTIVTGAFRFHHNTLWKDVLRKCVHCLLPVNYRIFSLMSTHSFVAASDQKGFNRFRLVLYVLVFFLHIYECRLH